MKKHLSYRTSFLMASLVTSMLPNPIISADTLQVKHTYVLKNSQREFVSRVIVLKTNTLNGSPFIVFKRNASIKFFSENTSNNWTSLINLNHHDQVCIKVTAKARSDPTHVKNLTPTHFCRCFTFLVQVANIPLDQDMHSLVQSA